MAYTKQTWVDNQTTVTAAHMQHIEDGIVTLENEKLGKTELDTAVETALTQAKESGEFKGDTGATGPAGPAGEAGYTPVKNVDYFDGEPGPAGPQGPAGEDGGYYTPSVDTAGNLSWEASKDGMFNLTGMNIRGPRGPEGTSVTIRSITMSIEPGADSVIEFSDGSILNVKNGKNGSDGAAGNDGYTPVKGVDYFDGEPGPAGPAGPAGEAGKDGYTPVRGTDYWTENDQEAIVQDVVSVLDELPEYVDAEIKDTASRLNAKAILGNVAIVGFSTDQHVSKWFDQQESTNTPGTILGLKALRRMADMFPFNAVVFGGDYANGSASSINEGVYMVYAPLTGAACPVMGTAGNHDSWQDQQDVTDAQIFKRHAARAKVDYPGFVPLDKISANGYYDDPTVNIRYIILDAEPRNTSASKNIAATINANLTAMLDGVPEGYKAIIFSHKPLNFSLGSSFKDGVNNAAVLEDNAEKIICCINGHGHTDASETLNGVLYIQTRAAAPTNYMGVADLSTAGTADETAFDVFVVDQEGGKIYAVRYGAGADRVFDIPVPNTEPVNEIPISTDTDGSIYNGVGYKTGCRINSSGVLKENETQYALTGFIPFKVGDVAYISPDVFEGNPGSCSISGFNADKVFMTNATSYANNSYGAIVTESDGSYSFDPSRMESGTSHWANMAYIRVTGVASMSSVSVITVNEEIT